MRAEQLKHLKMETQITDNKLKKLEREFEEIEKEISKSKEIGRLARLVVSGKLEKNLLTKKIGKEKNYATNKF